ncbi:MAG: hypothetical protein QOG17_1319 [Gammaproteobacteria bacterium]|nr:hypothetical protein [Gammaproteobacteria bacterium]
MSHSDPQTDLITPTLDDICAGAMQLQIAGRLDEAERLYRDILQIDARHAAANHCIGMLSVQLLRPLEAMPYLLAALEVNPQLPDYWLGYLEALLLAGQIEEAKSALALGRQHGLGGAAVEEFATRLQTPAAPAAPVDAAPAAPIKISRAELRRRQRLIRTQEDTLAGMLKQGRIADGLAFARSLTERFPERALGWKTMGALFFAERRADEAVSAMQRAIHAAPDDAESHKNLGTIFNKLDRLEEAEISLRRALQINPEYAAAYSHLGNTYQLQGRYAEAEACFRSAISLPAEDFPDDSYTGLLFMLSHNPSIGADALFAEHCRIGEHFGAGAPTSFPRHLNIPDPDRCLRVGFVSGDLCHHPIANFIEPILAQLQNRSGLEVHAYYTNLAEDDVSHRLRGYVKQWHTVPGLSAAHLAKKIMNDGIDVLIDLSGHTSLNRLRTFARKPAPIQISWIGYPGTTGLRAMDYYLADRHFLPPGQFDRHFTEKIAYLPANVPFLPHASAPSVGGLPALATGDLTFGSFNRLGKINATTIALWSRLLLVLPRAKMFLGSVAATEEQKLIGQFSAAGVSPERLNFHPRCDMAQYLALHLRVDICLDTYPYTGGTTTSHALWMGVPTLTVAGSTPAARQGAAFLGHLCLDDFVAKDAVDFVEKGLYWASHLTELSEVRAGMRDRWRRSAIGRPDMIAAGLERALRHMWTRWCESLPAESF